ncbi:MAG: hypothetical protein OHK0019_00730 [Saprospiraceae bacterium]
MTDIETHIGNWKKAVAGWQHEAWPEAIETHDEREYMRWSVLLNHATTAAKRGGYPASMRGAEAQSGGKKMWATANGKRLTIAYTPKPRKQAVTDTSKAAYQTINFDTVRGKVALCIMEATKAGGDITRNEIVEKTGLSVNNVCGRVNELLNAETPLRIEEKDWRLVVCGERLTNLPGAANVKNEALRFKLWKEEKAQLALDF